MTARRLVGGGLTATLIGLIVGCGGSPGPTPTQAPTRITSTPSTPTRQPITPPPSYSIAPPIKLPTAPTGPRP